MSDENLVQLEINDQVIEAKVGQTLIDVAEENGIDIPRFCYHKKLSIAANCRMCLVEVEKAPKPMPACATTVMEGMKVFTKSEKARASQKSVMEFLLINHPLDCPICDQGGECDLQDLAVSYGRDFSRFGEPKRIVKDKNLGSLVSTDMTRCIHCTRCVRFGKEIAGIVELGGLGRGEHMEIGTYVEKSLSSELSGNIIDLCPVGALTSKPFRFQARSWELTQTESIAPHDSLGSNVLIQSINNKIVRVLPKENEAINEIWLSDRDRFSYLGLNTSDRLTVPMVRNKQGNLEEVSWQNAFDIASAKIQGVVKEFGSESISVLASPNSTTEELYLLQKISAAIGTKNTSCRLPHAAPTNHASQISCSITDVENMDGFLLIGSDIQREIPLLSHRINKASQNGAKVHVVNNVTLDFNFKSNTQTDSAAAMLARLSEIAKHLLSQNSQVNLTGLDSLLKDVSVSEASQKIAEDLLSFEKSIVVLGNMAAVQANADTLYSLAQAISLLANMEFSYIDLGANTTGATYAGFKQSPENTSKLIQSAKALIVFGTELGADNGQAEQINQALSQVDFIVACSAYLTQELEDHADLILPIANFGETSGTFVNLQNDWQSFQGAVSALGESRPGWKVLRVLANHLDLDGFDFVSSQAVLIECQAQKITINANSGFPNQLDLVSDLQKPSPNIYDTDSLVRRSEPLQNTVLAKGERS